MIPPLPVIFIWAFFVLVVFRFMKPGPAVCVSIIGGYMLLPHGITLNFPLIPNFNKQNVPAMAALLGAALFARGKLAGVTALPGLFPKDRFVRGLGVLLALSFVMTVLTNGDYLVYGDTIRPGLRPYDALAGLQTMFVILIPALLARKYLSTPDGERILLLALCIAGAVYSLPVLFEVRMSPQLNQMIYGYFPHSWQQHVRGDGFRPIVFMQHGLWLSIFISGTTLAAFGCARLASSHRKILFLGVASLLLVTLILTKSLGALLITLCIVPFVLFTRARLQMLFASMIAASVLLYPMLRGSHLVPTTQIADGVSRYVSDQRARSLRFRFNNEEILLDKARQRPLFGWGGWGRSNVYNEYGNVESVVDGRWIILIGENGWLGYIAQFGLLTVPILLLTFRKRRYEVTLVTSILCLVLAGNLVDLIPNATQTPLTWLLAGSLIGRLERIRDMADESMTETARTASLQRQKLRYSRTRPKRQRLASSDSSRESRHSLPRARS